MIDARLIETGKAVALTISAWPVYWHWNASQPYAEQRLNQGSSVNVGGLFFIFQECPVDDFVNDEGGDQNVNPVLAR